MEKTKAEYQDKIANVFKASPVGSDDAVGFGAGYLLGSSPNGSMNDMNLRPGVGNLGSSFVGLLLTKTWQWREAFSLQGEMLGVLSEMNNMKWEECGQAYKQMEIERYQIQQEGGSN